MSKWISRECDLASTKGSAFKQVGFTDFSGLVPGSTTARLHGTLVFTMSLCSRFLMVTHGRTLYVYELNHVCFSRGPSWSLPLRPRDGRRLGMLRPAAIIVCPRRVISCSMDTSSGRNSVAVLMEGRMGIVCDIMAETNATLTQTQTWFRGLEDDSFGSIPNLFSRMPAAAAATATCVCQDTPVTQAPRLEEGQRSVYRSICHANDPPRSVAICPHRSCVAFGCTGGIELH